MSSGRRRLQYILRLFRPAGTRPQNQNFENHCNGFWGKKIWFSRNFFARFSVFFCQILWFFLVAFYVFFFVHFLSFLCTQSTIRRQASKCPTLGRLYGGLTVRDLVGRARDLGPRKVWPQILGDPVVPPAALRPRTQFLSFLGLLSAKMSLERTTNKPNSTKRRAP